MVARPWKTLFVGRTTVLSMKVSQNGKSVKGIRIKINGASLKLTTQASGANGVVKVRLQPKRPGERVCHRDPARRLRADGYLFRPPRRRGGGGYRG